MSIAIASNILGTDVDDARSASPLDLGWLIEE
jgi:hypothetical protein